MTNTSQHFLNLFVAAVFSFSHLIGFRATAQLPSLGGVQQMSPGAEYFAGRVEGKSLIKVNLVGGVRSPGVYYIPEETNLAELLAYAGGAVEGAALDNIRVRSLLGGKWEFKSYDFVRLSEEPVGFPTIRQGDIIQIDIYKDNLPRTALWVGIISAVTSLTFALLNYNKSR